MTYVPNEGPPPMAPGPVPPMQPGPVPQQNPGQTLGIVGLILGIILGPGAFIGLILSIVGLRKSKAVGMKNTPAVAGIVVSILVFLVSVAITVAMIIGLVALATTCAELGSGIHQVNGATITCG